MSASVEDTQAPVTTEGVPKQDEKKDGEPEVLADILITERQYNLLKSLYVQKRATSEDVRDILAMTQREAQDALNRLLYPERFEKAAVEFDHLAVAARTPR